MTQQLFISDLHLSAEGADRLQLFLNFLRFRATTAQTLYILGDLFDAWLGDDDQQSIAVEVRQALQALNQSGTDLKVMHGNRDFLLGEDFCRASGAQLISDPCLIDLYGTPTLLMHGDLLCTDDQEYQAFRKQIRSAEFASHFLSLSIDQRIAVAQEYRAKSGEANAQKSDDIMDVNQQAVESAMQVHQAQRLIHGHTHRPADHRFTLDSHTVRRHVLGEWHGDHAEILCATEDGVTRETITL
ncbi:MAG: UDP-2,3-diacylglucosamine diphosphatase [Candidatus Thiodiazotropha sp. (ex Ctena orbiculata)]|nr:UDP-2,3-diacylglucosamine diphosphatase [Candidatus Thiodiazotropha taylori]